MPIEDTAASVRDTRYSLTGETALGGAGVRAILSESHVLRPGTNAADGVSREALLGGGSRRASLRAIHTKSARSCATHVGGPTPGVLNLVLQFRSHVQLHRGVCADLS